MCDFKPGDEVVAAQSCVTAPLLLSAGQTYVVSRVEIVPVPGDEVRVFLVGVQEGCRWDNTFYGFPPSRFRKVERRNDSLSFEAFLTIKPGFEEPRRPKAPAKKRERVQ